MVKLNKYHSYKWNVLQINWLKENYKNYFYWNDLANDFNEYFNTCRTKESLKNCGLKKLGIKLSDKIGNDYTEEEIKWLMENAPNKAWKETTQRFLEKFGNTHTLTSLKCYCNRIGIYAGNDRKFKKGSVPKCRKEIGYERINKANGYTYVKVADNVFVSKQILMYEQYHNCKVDTNKYCVIFLDGDKRNFKKENLYLLDKSLSPAFNNTESYGNGKLTYAMIKQLELLKEIKELKNE